MWIYKPLSPHLSIYSINYSLISSILHRISALSNIIILSFLFVFLKIFIWGIKYKNLYFLFIFLTFILLNIFYLSFLYHSLNGCRHIIWDCNKYLNLSFSRRSFNSIFIILLVTLYTSINIFM